MRIYLVVLTAFSLVLSSTVNAQARPLTKRVIVKTNVLSLIAQRPTLSIEKPFSKTFSTELSFVQGVFNNILFTDHYAYYGFLLRAKKHFIEIDYDHVSPYVALYAGNLKRNIISTGQADNSGWFGYPSRNFSANSLRAGGSFGISYFAKSGMVIDAQSSLGYGRYIHLDKSDPDTYSNGYPDVQLWLSIGYSF